MLCALLRFGNVVDFPFHFSLSHSPDLTPACVVLFSYSFFLPRQAWRQLWVGLQGWKRSRWDGMGWKGQYAYIGVISSPLLLDSEEG